ncbi:MAG TPA: DUF4382 domain-containing protein [Candidatus Polarisedimenticolaceae bacterium]|nr:DUF4382 domain-containing protein [Candidatus Polarisedimenticolaceae bacterium]
MRNMGWKGAALAALVLTTLAAGGCSDSGSVTGGSSRGRVHVIMGGGASGQAMVAAPTLHGDDSGRSVASASVSLTSILARNLDGELVGVSMDLPTTIDLIDLIEGKTVDLPVGTLPVGTYDQLVVVIKSLHVVLSDGTQVDVTPPGGGWTAVVPTETFDVVDGQVTTVHLNFRSENAFRWVEGKLEFDPEFDCDVDHHHGHHDDDDDEDED